MALNGALGGMSGVSVLTGKSDGSFQAPLHFLESNAPLALAVDDFNRDQIQDVAVLTAKALIIYLGQGDGTYKLSALIHQAQTPERLAVADFNHDGNLDVAVTNNYNETPPGFVRISFGNGDGTFGSTQDLAGVGDHPFDVKASDVNGLASFSPVFFLHREQSSKPTPIIRLAPPLTPSLSRT
ncbi:MAG: VCBS repeat-containing protein [Acidobacteriales bacterium]|nr:VCBS repeat-containing protein [Terriglobales bacterium]